MTKAEMAKRIEKLQNVLNEMRESLTEEPVAKRNSVEARETDYRWPANTRDTGI
jgi:hypothetical protein